MISAGTTMYLKITGKNGVSRIEQREAWDTEKFLASVIKQYAEDKDNPSKVSIATRKDYLKQLKKG